jgi:putative DNA primase/helicase
MVLSNGERSIDCAMSEAGKQIKARQSLRLLSIPIFGKYGAFDCLHDKKDGRDLSDHLQTAATKFYGVAGIEYLTKLVTETCNLDQLATDYTEALINGETLSSQELRAAKRFGLLMLAGELATEYGVTGWQTGDAVNGVAECFAKWRESFGGGDIEERQVLQSVKDFIDRYGDSRFSNLNDDNPIKINDRAGYWLDENEGRIYLFNDAGMTEALEKNGLKRGLEVLKNRGWLILGSDGRNKKQQRVHGKQERFYAVRTPEAH